MDYIRPIEARRLGMPLIGTRHNKKYIIIGNSFNSVEKSEMLQEMKDTGRPISLYVRFMENDITAEDIIDIIDVITNTPIVIKKIVVVIRVQSDFMSNKMQLCLGILNESKADDITLKILMHYGYLLNLSELFGMITGISSITKLSIYAVNEFECALCTFNRMIANDACKITSVSVKIKIYENLFVMAIFSHVIAFTSIKMHFMSSQNTEMANSRTFNGLAFPQCTVKRLKFITESNNVISNLCKALEMNTSVTDLYVKKTLFDGRQLVPLFQSNTSIICFSLGGGTKLLNFGDNDDFYIEYIDKNTSLRVTNNTNNILSLLALRNDHNYTRKTISLQQLAYIISVSYGDKKMEWLPPVLLQNLKVWYDLYGKYWARKILFGSRTETYKRYDHPG